MNFKKIIILLMSFMMVFSFGCTSKTANVNNSVSETTVESSEVVETTTETVPVKQSLVMVTNAEFPPYEYKEGNDFLGIDVEIAKAICESAGKELNILDIAFDSVIPSIINGKADMALSGITVTEERKENIDFSDTYMTAVQSVIVMENSDIKEISDLEGKLIGVQTGTTGDMYCSDDYGDENVKRYNKISDAVQAMKSGSIDCCVIDDQVAIAMIQANEGLKVLDTSYATEEYAIGVQKGNKELLDIINKTLADLKSSGKLDSIISKYIK